MARKTGRPPVPAEVKRKRGNPGGRPIPEPAGMLEPNEGDPPEPARPLGAQGRKLWDDLWSSGIYWLAPATDRHWILQMCEMEDERLALRYEVLKTGDRLKRVALRTIERAIRDSMLELGLTPLQRTRMAIGEVSPSGQDDLADLRKKRQQVIDAARSIILWLRNGSVLQPKDRECDV